MKVYSQLRSKAGVYFQNSSDKTKEIELSLTSILHQIFPLMGFSFFEEASRKESRDSLVNYLWDQ